jgi:hypothetical protein
LLLLALSVSGNGPARNHNRVVSFDVSVTDSKGVPVDNLRRENLRVFEDNVEQSHVQFSAGERQITLAILVDNSDTFAYFTPDLTEPAATLVRSLREWDRAEVISFDAGPQMDRKPAGERLHSHDDANHQSQGLI